MIRSPLTPLALMIAVLSVGATAHAAALDRSGQSIAPFFTPGNYAELGYSFLDPSVAGTDASGNRVPEMAKTYDFWSGIVKISTDPAYSFALIYDQPFGANVEYTGVNNFTATNPATPYALSAALQAPYGALGITGNTKADVTSENVTGILGYKPMPSLQIYGGMAWQDVEGDVYLRGPAYKAASGYDLHMSGNSNMGGVIGAAFEKPEIALRAALTYRTSIKHSLPTTESLVGVNALGAAGVAAQGGTAAVAAKVAALQTALAADPTNATIINNLTQLKTLQAIAAIPSSKTSVTEVKTPQSVNLDFQTGIMAGTLLFANVRWVDWSESTIKPALYAQVSGLAKPGGLNLASYDKDQWSATLGVGRKFNDQLSASLAAGWDSGAGNPITSLGPTEGYTNIGLGVKYTLSPQVDISVGAKYFWLGDADAALPDGTIVGHFEGNNAMAYGMKIGYHF